MATQQVLAHLYLAIGIAQTEKAAGMFAHVNAATSKHIKPERTDAGLWQFSELISALSR
jgi:hypothetical protein